MTKIRAALTVLLLCCSAAYAGPMRCGGKLIDTGVSLGYVLAQCGTPEYQTTRTVPVRTRNAIGFSSLTSVAVSEQLIYDRGFGRFPAQLEFVNGELRHIELLFRQRNLDGSDVDDDDDARQ